MVTYGFDYSEEKNIVLKEIGRVGFEDIIKAINKGGLLDDIDHFNKKRYPNQRILIVKLKRRVYAVPYVPDRKRGVKFLKTIYPSRSLKEKYLI
jgi:hypothetical protein